MVPDQLPPETPPASPPGLLVGHGFIRLNVAKSKPNLFSKGVYVRVSDIVAMEMTRHRDVDGTDVDYVSVIIGSGEQSLSVREDIDEIFSLIALSEAGK